MTARAVGTVPYGLRELRALYQRYATWALLTAVTIHMAAVGSYYLLPLYGEKELPGSVVRVRYTDLRPPPSITNTDVVPPVAVSVPLSKPTNGIPVPVPDAEVNPDQTIASQDDLSADVGPEIAAGDGSVATQIEPDLAIEEEPPPYVPVERLPLPVKQVSPEYPEFARRIGAQGTVWVKIWVDQEGRAHKAVVEKSDNDLFNEAAVKAALQWVFTPALMNNGPVSVWVSVPFRFKLNN